jgi:hypothetical protein
MTVIGTRASTEDGWPCARPTLPHTSASGTSRVETNRMVL